MIRRTYFLTALIFVLVSPLRAQTLLEDRFFDSNGVMIRYVEAVRIHRTERAL